MTTDGEKRTECTERTVIQLAVPDITGAEIRAVMEVLKSGRLSIGPQLEAFERAVAERAGREYAVGVNSGTSALDLALRAYGIREGDEVITTPFTFVATTNVILAQRAVPVFVGIDDSYNMVPVEVEAAITPKTRAILAVSVFGNMAHFDEYRRIADKHSVVLIEDSCESLGSYRAGTYGDAAAFAFYPNKQVTTGEGGMLVTDDRRVANLCRALRNHGQLDGEYLHMGFNYRMDEMSAALGLAQMGRLDELLIKRAEVASHYDFELTDRASPATRPPRIWGEFCRSWFAYVVRLPGNREAVMARLAAWGIETAAYFPLISKMRHVQGRCRAKRQSWAAHEPMFQHEPLDIESCAACTLALPFHTKLTRRDVRYVAEQLDQAIKEC